MVQRFSLIIFAFVLIVPAGLAQDPPAAAPEPSASPPESKPAIADLSPEQLEAALRNVQDEIGSQQVAPAGRDETPAERLTLLRDIENAIQRRIGTHKRIAETQQTIADTQQRIQTFAAEGLEMDPPYSVAFVDKIRDDLRAQQRETETDALAVEAAASSLAQASERVTQAEQRRREASDNLDAATADDARARFRRELELARLNQRLAEHDHANAAAQLELAELEHALSELRAELLAQQVAAASENVVFRRSELDATLADLQSRQDALQNELRELQRTDAANQSRLAAARSDLDQARDETVIREKTEALAAREAWAQATSRGLELVQRRIDIIAKEQVLWERRYALAAGASARELALWDRETRAVLDEAERRRNEAERRLQDLRTTKLELQNRINHPETPFGVRTQLESRLNALTRREEYASAYLSGLLELERLAQRLLDQVERKRSIDSWRGAWAHLRLTTEELWGRELFSIDDRAFRVGALIRSGIIFFVVYGFVGLVRVGLRRTLIRHLRENAKTTDTSLDDILLAITRNTRPTVIFLFALYAGLRPLPLSERLEGWLDSAAIVVGMIQVALWGTVALKNVIERTKRRRVESDPSSVSAFGLILFFGRVAIWAVVLLIALDNLGVEITALIAGLGVGGIAIAFALQNILGDVFCSIAILLDKPFVVGDFIVVGDLMGSVENIGIKTTRLRSLSGEQIVFSNADLLASRIRNYKRMYERRVAYTFGLIYDTPVEKIEEVPKLMQEIIEEQEPIRFDRAHFKGYGEFALEFEIVYYVLDPDYNLFMDIQQTINLRMYREFKKRGITFAYPTRELVIRGSGQQAVTPQTQLEPKQG